MRVLVLGGTAFVGRHVVEVALRRGHDVTLFTRGRTNPGLFPDVELLRGDRDGDLSALESGTWDVVVDTSGFVPRVVRRSAELLRDRTGLYVFISSIAVYPDMSIVPDETYAVEQLTDTASEDVARDYGALKAAGESVVREIYGEQALVVRPGLIGGPWDPSGRVTYWPVRVAEGGDVLAPGSPEHPVQFVDVRDVTAWIVALCEARTGGVFNATGPAKPLTMGRFLDACCAATGSDARFVWIEDEPLLRAGVEPWFELPLWWPEQPGKQQVDIGRAIEAGLRLRPIEDTISDVVAWAGDLAGEPPRQDDGRYRIRTLSRRREQQLIAELTRTDSDQRRRGSLRSRGGT